MRISQETKKQYREAIANTDRFPVFQGSTVAALLDEIDQFEGVAAIAHDGGLLHLSESAALAAIRRLTASYWSPGAMSEDRRREAVYNALTRSPL